MSSEPALMLPVVGADWETVDREHPNGCIAFAVTV